MYIYVCTCCSAHMHVCINSDELHLISCSARTRPKYCQLELLRCILPVVFRCLLRKTKSRGQGVLNPDRIGNPRRTQILFSIGNMYVSMFVSMYLSTYLCIYVSMFVSMYLSTYLCIYVSMFVSMYLSTYLRIYVCIYVSMYL